MWNIQGNAGQWKTGRINVCLPEIRKNIQYAVRYYWISSNAKILFTSHLDPCIFEFLLQEKKLNVEPAHNVMKGKGKRIKSFVEDALMENAVRQSTNYHIMSFPPSCYINILINI